MAGVGSLVMRGAVDVLGRNAELCGDKVDIGGVILSLEELVARLEIAGRE